MKALWLIAGVGAWSGSARADDIDAPAATFHKNQVGISARLAFGYRGIAPHDDHKTYCGAIDESGQNNTVCTSRMPTMLDLEAAYGVAEHIELTVELGLGLEKDFGSAMGADDGPHPFHIAPGARFFFSEAKHAKLFVQPMFLLDVAGYNTAGGSRGTEIGVRSIEGFWIDLHRTYGVYFFVGETAGFTPWIEAEFEGGLGFQGRYP